MSVIFIEPEDIPQSIREMEHSLRVDLDALFIPGGRQAAADRFEMMCGLNPTAIGFGPIDRSSPPWWKNAHQST